MKAAELLNAQSIISGMLNAVCAERTQENYPSVESDQKGAALALALRLIDKELSIKLQAAGAGDVVRQYDQGLITMNEMCNMIVEIATTLK